MKITLQYFDGCPNWALLDARIADVVGGRPDVEVVHQRVETPEDASRLGFRGSPTVLIDGVDPFAEDSAPGGLACRMFRTPDGLAGSPTVEQLSAAIFERSPGGRAIRGQYARRGPLNSPPIACTLSPDAGKGQVGKWRSFDDDYLLATERAETTLTVHYAKVDDAVRRLRELVENESACCPFVDWAIEESHRDLRLVVTGSAEQLAALDVG